MKKKLNFDVLALVSTSDTQVAQSPTTSFDSGIRPQSAPAFSISAKSVSQKDVRLKRPSTIALRLANAIRRNCFVIPQLDMLGEHMTGGPSPIQVLRFQCYEIYDFELRRAIKELDDGEKKLVQSYLWNAPAMKYDKEHGKWIELDPPFDDDTERAFKKVFRSIKSRGALRVRAWRRE